MKPRILLAGYYGAGNLGDDAIMLGFLQKFPRSAADVTILSGNPEETHRLYGVQAVPRRELPMVREAIADCDALVFAGGSIFQDVTSFRSVAYYAQLVRWATKAGKKTVMVGQGIGPLTTFFGKRFARQAFNCSTTIAVRDPASMATLKKLGVSVPIEVTADLAYLLPKPPLDSSVESFEVAGMRSVGLAPRPHGKGNEVVQLFAEVIRLLYQSKWMPVMIELDRLNDGPLIAAIDKACGGKAPSIRNIATPMMLQQRLQRLHGVIAMRLHAGILSTTVGVPPTLLSYDPKVTAFAKLMGLPPAVDVSRTTAAHVVEEFLKLQKSREKWAESIESSTLKLQREAERNIEIVLKTIGSRTDAVSVR